MSDSRRPPSPGDSKGGAPAEPGRAAAELAAAGVRFSRTPERVLRERLARAREAEAAACAPSRLADAELPTWLRPFTLPPNLRFTRTPDYLLAGRPAPVGAEVGSAIDPVVAQAVDPVASPPETGEDDAATGFVPEAPVDLRPLDAPEAEVPPVRTGAAGPAGLDPGRLGLMIQVGPHRTPAAVGDQDNRPLADAAPSDPLDEVEEAEPFSPAQEPEDPAEIELELAPLLVLPRWRPRLAAPTEAPPEAPPVSRPPTPLPPVPVRTVGAYDPPALTLLAEPVSVGEVVATPEQLQANAVDLEQVVEDFGVRGSIVSVRPGPVVTLYELEPAPGTKSARVIGLSDDIARSMAAVSARVAVVQGRNAIGIELPNARRETVYLRELLAHPDFATTPHRLALALGKTIGGEPVVADLARMPHLLVAGTTGSGKSVAINTMILSLLYRLPPEACRLIMVDPKMLELSVYDGIPHLLAPVVTDPKKAVVALKWAVREMEERYKKMSKLAVRNIDGFNARVAEARARGEVLTRTVQTGFDRETGAAVYEEEAMELTALPYIVVIVDEMADLMMVAGKDIEGAIQRLAQMARAAGIHLIMATQRPSVDVITGTIKANFPTRISFQVTSKIDSRTILGEMGAEQLLGQGDMLYMAGGGRVTRVHGPFCSDGEVEAVVAHLKRQGRPAYLEAVTTEDDVAGSSVGGSSGGAGSGTGGVGGSSGEGEEPVFDAGAFGAGLTGDVAEAGLYAQAVGVVLRDRKASTSYIQRRLQVGYNRAASLMERMESEGIVGPANHAGKRDILTPDEEER